MSQKSALYIKRKHSIRVKLDQLKTESDIAINYIKKMFDKGTTFVAKLEGVDQTTFLQRYPQVNEELDRLVNKVVHLNYILEFGDGTEELQMNPAISNAALVLPDTAVNFIKEELPLIETGHIYNSSVPCDIQEGDILDMCYLHGDDPFNFWLRYYSTKALEEVIEIIMCRFNGGRLKSCENPCIGMYICVCDGEYFRGRIMKLLKERVEVLNVDSGQTKVVTMKHIFHLDEDLSSVHVQCINCCLQGDLIDVSLWNDTVANLFSQILRDSNLVVTVRAKLPDGPSHFIVEVDCHNEERIISKIELSKWLTLDVFPLLCQVQQNSLNTDSLMVLFRCLDRFNTEEETHSDMNILQQSLTFEVNTNDAVGGCVEEIPFTNKLYMNVPEEPDIPSSPEPLIRSTSAGCEISSDNTALGYDNDKNTAGSDNMSEPVEVEKCMFALIQRALDSSVGQCYDAMIAHIEDPGEFYIHVVCAENTEIDNVGKQMNEFYEKIKIPLKTKSEAKECIGTFCAAYSSIHQHWYRGQIINWNENNSKLIHVKFVDYGDEHFLPLEAIQPLVHVFTKFPIFALRCDLANIHPVRSFPKNLQKTWPIESINLFKCLVDMNTLYTVIVRKADQNDNSLSVLLCDNRNEVCINKSMVNYGYAINFSPFEGPLDFGFQLKNDGKFDSSGCKQKSTSIQTELVPASEVQRRASESKQIPVSETNVFHPLDQWDPMGEDFYSLKNNVYHDDEDATYVVTGYKPQDETRICKLFTMTGKCYKGQTCLKQHSFVHPDGWTTDKEEIFHEAFNMLTLPREGTIIRIQVTEIVNANTFWAIIIDDVMSEVRIGGCNYSEVDGKDQQEETLLTLNDYLNEAHNVKALKRLQIEPAVGQIVLAKYIDNRYYRAQVVESEENNIVVVFVDYGNKECVNLYDIRGIEQRYLHLPFQAIECVLANVEHITDGVDGVEVFQTLLGKNNIVFAKVVNSYKYPARLEVLVVDSEGYDLGTKIIQSAHGKAVY